MPQRLIVVCTLNTVQDDLVQVKLAAKLCLLNDRVLDDSNNFALDWSLSMIIMA